MNALIRQCQLTIWWNFAASLDHFSLVDRRSQVMLEFSLVLFVADYLNQQTAHILSHRASIRHLHSQILTKWKHYCVWDFHRYSEMIMHARRHKKNDESAEELEETYSNLKNSPRKIHVALAIWWNPQVHAERFYEFCGHVYHFIILKAVKKLENRGMSQSLNSLETWFC